MEGFTWTARSLHPKIPVLVAGVFLSFMALAFFVFHSEEAVKALLFTAVGSIVATLPAVLNRLEYRLDKAGVHKRPLRKKDPADFKTVFMWGEVSYFLPTNSGFKYYRPFETSNPLSRLIKEHLLSDYSGEFHVGKSDRDRVRDAIRAHEIPLSKPSESRRMASGQETRPGV